MILNPKIIKFHHLYESKSVNLGMLLLLLLQIRMTLEVCQKEKIRPTVYFFYNKRSRQLSLFHFPLLFGQ